jgi:hypothetical protein
MDCIALGMCKIIDSGRWRRNPSTVIYQASLSIFDQAAIVAVTKSEIVDASFARSSPPFWWPEENALTHH